VNVTALDALMRPESVAIVGASSEPTKIGYTVVKNIIEGGYKGKIYPINPKASEILGLKAYPSLQDTPGPVDAAVITVPSKLVLSVIEDAGKKGVKGVIIITSGFGEVGNKDLEAELVTKAKEYGIRIMGPNIVGTLSNAEKLNASFAPLLPLVGKGALVSQSGALLIALDMATFTRKVGLEKLISIGNMSDVDFADLVEWLDKDDATSCISLYIEGFKDGRKFMEAAKKASKPVIALKAGVSAHGAAAAASHTGSLAGAAKVYGAAFQQAGVVQATDLNNLFDLSLALSLQPPMKGDNLVIITNGGGVGVLATDAAEKYNLPLKFVPKDVQDELKKHMPEFGSAKNPVDLTGMAGYDWYHDSVKFAYAHDWTEGLVVLYCETAMTNPMDIAQGIKKAVVDSGVKGKPVIVSFVGGEKSEKAMQWLVENEIPSYSAPDLAVHAISALREYARMKEIVSEPEEILQGIDKDLAMRVIKSAREDGRDSLTEIEAKQVFSAYGLPTTVTKLAKTEDEALKLAKEIGYPIVMKIVSPEILHKSDAGGVKVNIKDDASCRDAYNTIMKNAKAYKADAHIHGVAVQEMAPWGTEVILGSINDATFGPTVMFGLGGIFVEVLKDVTFRVAPVSKKSALRMIEEIRGAPILAGVRGEQPRDREVLAETISRYAHMIVDLRSEISESDANPVLVYEEGKGLKVVDARIILKKK
jgi:acetyltransferase